MYQVVVEKQAQKQLAQISSSFYENIIAVLQDLAPSPRPHGSKN